jgi:hypothetical protein
LFLALHSYKQAAQGLHGRRPNNTHLGDVFYARMHFLGQRVGVPSNIWEEYRDSHMDGERPTLFIAAARAVSNRKPPRMQVEFDFAIRMLISDRDSLGRNRQSEFLALLDKPLPDILDFLHENYPSAFPDDQYNNSLQDLTDEEAASATIILDAIDEVWNAEDDEEPPIAAETTEVFVPSAQLTGSTHEHSWASAAPGGAGLETGSVGTSAGQGVHGELRPFQPVAGRSMSASVMTPSPYGSKILTACALLPINQWASLFISLLLRTRTQNVRNAAATLPER